MSLGDGIAVGCLALGVAYLAGVIAQLQHKAWVLRWERQERALFHDAWDQMVAQQKANRQARSGN